MNGMRLPMLTLIGSLLIVLGGGAGSLSTLALWQPAESVYTADQVDKKLHAMQLEINVAITTLESRLIQRFDEHGRRQANDIERLARTVENLSNRIDNVYQRSDHKG